jgi:hypothetical protein
MEAGDGAIGRRKPDYAWLVPRSIGADYPESTTETEIRSRIYVVD